MCNSHQCAVCERFYCHECYSDHRVCLKKITNSVRILFLLPYILFIIIIIVIIIFIIIFIILIKLWNHWWNIITNYSRWLYLTLKIYMCSIFLIKVREMAAKCSAFLIGKKRYFKKNSRNMSQVRKLVIGVKFRLFWWLNCHSAVCKVSEMGSRKWAIFIYYPIYLKDI